MDLGQSGHQLLGMEGSPVQAETAAATIKDYYIPFEAEIIKWGVLLTEDFVTHSTGWVVELAKLDKEGGTVTSIDTLTVNSSNTKLFKGDGSDAEKTVIAADTDLDNGQNVVAQLKSASRVLTPGQILRLKVKTAANTAGGAGVVWVLLRISGLDERLATVWHEKE